MSVLIVIECPRVLNEFDVKRGVCDRSALGKPCKAQIGIHLALISPEADYPQQPAVWAGQYANERCPWGHTLVGEEEVESANSQIQHAIDVIHGEERPPYDDTDPRSAS